jgi:D-alanyl-D-alanine carboxypeptidase (penicillin-binding protein 5/6)
VALVVSAAVVTLLVAPAALAAPASRATPAALAARAVAASGTPLSAAARSAVGGPLMARHGVVVNYPSGRHVRHLPRVPASAYVIADASTGQVLAAKDPHGQYGPASTLKVLTAVALIPRLNPNAMITATKREAQVEPNDVGLLPRHKYQIDSLFKALLMISANDAALALTQATGSFSKGMALINAEAHHLQAYDVVAKKPNGLPADGQVVSAYDEALIARRALAIPAFMRYDSMLAARFHVKKRKWATLANQNTLLTQYRGGLGGKIGWTEKSKATYIGMARRNGVTLIVTLLRCRPLAEITSGERLLDWGFAMDGKVKPVGTLVAPLQATTAARQAPAGGARKSAGKGGNAGKAGGHRPAGGGRSQSPGSQAEAGSGGGGNGGVEAGLAIGAGVVAMAAVGLGSMARARRRRDPS